MRRLLVLLFLAGCGSSGGDSAGGRRTLVVAYGGDEFPLVLNRERLGRYPLNAGICEPLVRLAGDFSVAPALAIRWTVHGPNEVRFILRHGVAFSDGTPLDARAVAHTLMQATRTRTDYSFLADSSVRVVDDTTLDVRPARANRRLVDQLVHPTYGILAPGSDPTRRPMCTGPFRLVDYVAHDHLTVVRNDRYWGEHAKLDTLIFRFVPDETTRMLALRSGEVDAIVDVGHANANALEHVAGVRVVTAPPGAVIVMCMNLNGNGPYAQLRDTALRRAVAMAIDRRRLIASVLGDRSATHVATVNPPGVLGPYASLVRGIPYDPGAATHALHGRRRSLQLIAQPGSIDRATVEYVQAELARVGIDVAVEQLDAAAYESRLNSGAIDLDLELPNQNDANPAFLLALRWYSRSGTRSAAFTHAGLRFDTLVERALEAMTDDGARRAAAEAMQQLVDVEVGALPLAGISRIYAMTDRVRGFVPHPSRVNQDWSTVWVAR
ncbi:MAG: ABC transporter substrate-binding protein [Gemmatimonadota bacterium]|nr:ABC transporter substrate-binding protein [Gemmatimonadota bacterium]